MASPQTKSPGQFRAGKPTLLRRSYRLLLERWRLLRASGRNTRVTPAEMARGATAGKLRVVWVLAGNEWVGSARLKGLVVDDYFRGENKSVFSRVAYMPDSRGLDPVLKWMRFAWQRLLKRGVDVLVFQTRTGATERLLRDCKEVGISTVFSISDLDFDTVPSAVWELADAVVVSSELLKTKAEQLHSRVELIDDPVDVPIDYTLLPNSPSAGGLDCLWIGHPDRWGDVDFLRQVLACPDLACFRLKTISRHPEATHQWEPAAAWDNARRGDIALVPAQLSERGMAKSSNRLACFMALGFPVVATPIPSYRAHIRHGENGFLATSLQDWRDCLRLLRDPELRRTMGENARRTETVRALSIPGVAARWETLFRSLRAERLRFRTE